MLIWFGSTPILVIRCLLTRPPPNSSEHALVESVGERGGEQGVDGGQVSGRKEPFRGVEDAVLLGGV